MHSAPDFILCKIYSSVASVDFEETTVEWADDDFVLLIHSCCYRSVQNIINSNENSYCFATKKFPLDGPG